MKRTIPYLFLTLGLLMSTLTMAKVIYVDANAPGPTYDGTTWGNAYTSLQDALTEAVATDTIAVAAGTYTPHSSSRTTYFNLKEGVVMLGSFDGSEIINETSIDERDFESNASVLSADLSGDDDGFTNNTENAYHVLYARATASSITVATVIDGFEITGGNANVNGGTNYEYMRGGGIYLEATMPYTVSPTFRNVYVHHNSAQQGGGVFISSLTSATCSPSFNVFYISNNRADETTDTQLTTAAGISVSAFDGTSNPTFSLGLISDNIVTGSTGVGGGMALSANEVGGSAQCSPTVLYVIFCNNVANGGGSHVAAVSQGNGAQVIPVFTNVTMAGHAANSVFYNSVTGAEASACNPVLVNTIIYTDISTSMRNVPHALSTPDPQISYCNIKSSGGSGSWDTDYGTNGGNNIDEVPLFVDTTECDVRLYAGSPGLGQGDGVTGTDIGWYQGPGLIYLDIEDIADYESCNGDTLFTFKLELVDEAEDNAAYDIALGDGALELSNISHSFSNDSLQIEIRVADTLSGTDTLTIYYTNDENEADTTDFVFTLTARPPIPVVGFAVFGYADSTYVIHLNNNWSATGLRNVLDGNSVTDQYFYGVEPGIHHAQFEEDGCFSDSVSFELVPYLNEIDLEISNVGDTTNFYICEGDDGTIRVECTIKDDYPELAELSYRGDFSDPIPEENITFSETDTSYIFEVVVPDNIGFYRLSIHAEDIYMNMANLYYDFNRGGIPSVDSVMVQEYSPGYICLTVDLSGTGYSYLTQLYMDGEQLTGDWSTICDVETGAHTMQVVYDGCASNIYAFNVESENEDELSILTNSKHKINIYPVPASHEIILEGIDQSGFISIYSLSGERMEYAAINIGQPFDISTIPSGSYILTFTNDTYVIQRKLVVSR